MLDVILPITVKSSPQASLCRSFTSRLATVCYTVMLSLLSSCRPCNFRDLGPLSYGQWKRLLTWHVLAYIVTCTSSPILRSSPSIYALTVTTRSLLGRVTSGCPFHYCTELILPEAQKKVLFSSLLGRRLRSLTASVSDLVSAYLLVICIRPPDNTA